MLGILYYAFNDSLICPTDPVEDLNLLYITCLDHPEHHRHSPLSQVESSLRKGKSSLL